MADRAMPSPVKAGSPFGKRFKLAMPAPVNALAQPAWACSDSCSVLSQDEAVESPPPLEELPNGLQDKVSPKKTSNMGSKVASCAA